MTTAPNLSIDHPHAVAVVVEALAVAEPHHRTATERIDSLATNAGSRAGMRAIYHNKLTALVKATNDMVAFLTEINARMDDDILEVADREVADLVRGLAPAQRGPSDADP